MEGTKPSVGRIVHYVSYGTPGGEFTSQCRAAIVTEVVPETPDNQVQGEIESWDAAALVRVGLCVMNPTGLFLNQGLRYDPNGAGGTWHWPER
jgi:hypothetical protein